MLLKAGVNVEPSRSMGGRTRLRHRRFVVARRRGAGDFLLAPFDFDPTRSGSFFAPVSRFHSSNVSFEIFPSTSNCANFRRCAWLLKGIDVLRRVYRAPAARVWTILWLAAPFEVARERSPGMLSLAK